MLRYFFDVTIWEVWPIVGFFLITFEFFVLILLFKPAGLLPQAIIRGKHFRKFQFGIALFSLFILGIHFWEFFAHEQEFRSYWDEAAKFDEIGPSAVSSWQGYCIQAENRNLIRERRWAILNAEIAMLKKGGDPETLLRQVDSLLDDLDVVKQWAVRDAPQSLECNGDRIYTFGYATKAR